MIWVNNGTVAVVNGSTTVIGTGTSWGSNAVSPGDAFHGPDGRTYPIAEIVSDNEITLQVPYDSSNAPIGSYSIQPTRAFTRQVLNRISAFNALMDSFEDGPLSGRFEDGTAALPAIASQTDPDTGLFFPASNQLGASTGGVRRWLLSNTAFQVDVPITGTAAQSSPTDATAGKLLKAGAFGLGSTGFGSLLPSGDIDDTSTPSGEYRIDDTMSGVFPTVAMTTVDKFGMLRVSRRTSDEISQIYVTAGGLYGANIMYHRTYITSSSAWSVWSMQYGTEQVLISPSKDGNGNLSGGLMSKVSGANGTAYHYANGMQVCTHEITLDYATPDILAQSWTYPGLFTSPPICLIGLSNQGSDYTGVSFRDVGQCFVNPESSTVGTINLYRAAGAAAVWGATAAIAKVRVTAIGERTL